MNRISSQSSFPFPASSDNLLQNDLNLLTDFDFDLDFEISNLPPITDFSLSDVFDDLDDAAVDFQISDLPANGFSSDSSSSSILDAAAVRPETLTPPQNKTSEVGGIPCEGAPDTLNNYVSANCENYSCDGVPRRGQLQNTNPSTNATSSSSVSAQGDGTINHGSPSKDVQSCSSSGSPQENDPKLDKRQRRMLRNRELAHESRQRKKSYVAELEAKCKRLEQERDMLQQQIYYSRTENAVLMEELSRTKKMKGCNGMAEPAVLFKNSLPLEFLSFLICLCLLLEQLPQCVHLFLAFDKVRTSELAKELVGSSSPNSFYHIGIHSPMVPISVKDPG